MEQHNRNVEDQLRHVRRLLGLIQQCKMQDPLHEQQLVRIQQRLIAMESNMQQLIRITDDAIDEYAKLTRHAQNELEDIGSELQSLFV